MIGFVDIETTGLDPNRCKILEVGLILTKDDISRVTSNSFCVHQDEFILQSMNDWCKDQHRESGLIQEVQKEGIPLREVEEELVKCFKDHVPEGEQVPMAGNSVHFDRDFLKRHMPEFENCFHYRNIDVSIFKELLPRWDMEDALFDAGEAAHRAIEDAQDSMKALRYYRQEFF